MLQNTFCHLRGIGPKIERQLWDGGITSWDELLGIEELPANNQSFSKKSLANQIHQSFHYLEEQDAGFFARNLESTEHWRLFPAFRGSCAFLDIETTGLDPYSDHITTIAIYDGQRIRHYVRGENLDCFPDDIPDYQLIVTYYGKRFDIPFLERQFGVQLKQAHIDLCYVLRSLGITGGLKKCEKRLGIKREGMEDIDGFTAVLLWHEYQRTGNQNALETLLAYNIQDTVNLENLMIEAYNRKVTLTPFRNSHRLAMTSGVLNPFHVHQEVVHKILHRK